VFSGFSNCIAPLFSVSIFNLRVQFQRKQNQRLGKFELKMVAGIRRHCFGRVFPEKKFQINFYIFNRLKKAKVQINLDFLWPTPKKNTSSVQFFNVINLFFFWSSISYCFQLWLITEFILYPVLKSWFYTNFIGCNICIIIEMKNSDSFVVAFFPLM